MKDVDSNAMDYSYQHKYPEFPEVPRPILAAAWESNNYDAVDVLLEMEPDTRVLWTDDAESKNPPKPLFFQVSQYSYEPMFFKIHVGLTFKNHPHPIKESAKIPLTI